MPRSSPAAEEPKLEWDDIQGNVLRGYGFDHGRHLVLRIGAAHGARRWLRRLLDRDDVTPASPWSNGDKPASTLNVAFTHRGLAAIGLDPTALASFPRDFREGMRARAETKLGDTGGDGPSHWEDVGVHSPSAHVLAMIHAPTRRAAQARRDSVLANAEDEGLELVATQEAANVRDPDAVWSSQVRLEHFGFADGVSQPAVRGAAGQSVVAGNGTPLRDGTWAPVAAGEFVLGYPDEEEDSPPLPEPPLLVRNGSFLVYRKLYQDVAAFRRLTHEIGRRHRLDPDLVVAKLVGRRTNGTPLVRPVSDADGPEALNDVHYGPDPRGHGCPVGSHVRRSNPRDALQVSPKLVSRHRMLRRGMPYGPPLPEGVMDDDGRQRGLVFMAYCASISRQFEFVQREWLNDGNVFGIGHTADPIAGHGSAPRRFALERPDESPLLLGDLPRLVRPRAGEYFFLPSRQGLRTLATEPG